LRVVALQPEVVLGDQLLPGLGLRKGVVGQAALQIEVGLDEARPGLPSLDLQLLYAQSGVDGLGPVGTEDPAPVGDDGPGRAVTTYGRVEEFAISSRLSGGCSALRSTIFLRMAGGSTLRFALGAAKRLAMPSSPKAAILR
jgi:hypothetical protein